MRYKIPVQIENEDTIVFGLSLRQLMIIGIGGGFAYSIFKKLAEFMDPTAALIFSAPLFLITAFIALFRKSEMTFLPWVLNLLRLQLSPKDRIWQSSTESFSNNEIGYVTESNKNEKEKIDTKASNEEVYADLQEKLKKL